jgi:hypothetical protein
MKLRGGVLAVTMGLAIVAGVGVATAVFAHPGGVPSAHGGMCGGPGRGPGGGHGGDMMGIHALFANRDQIRRTVTPIEGGVRTTTESNDPAVVAQLRAHVQAMYARLEDGRPINARDPLFAALFENADKIHVKTENTAKGITVTETSDDAEVAALIRRHAETVNKFIANGMPEMMRTH